MGNKIVTATRVKELRDRLEMSQDAFAAALGYSRNYVSQIELGREPGKRFLHDLATFAKMRGLEELLTSVHESSLVVEARGITPRERLQNALLARKLTTTQFAKLIHYDTGVIDYVLSGGRASEAMIEAIVRELPELTKEDLMDGSDMPPIIAEAGAVGTYGAKPNILLPLGMKGRMVPLLSAAQAGAWDAGHSDEGWTGEAIFALNVDDRRAFGMRVSGNSMEPAIREGDVVICSPEKHPSNGEAAVIKTKSGQAFIKFWKKSGPLVSLLSANPDYKPIEFPLAEIAGAWPVVQQIYSGRITTQL